jgi:hypothetical protein
MDDSGPGLKINGLRRTVFTRRSAMPDNSITFRDQALARLREALGEPEVLVATPGNMYRWILKRSDGLHVYVTLDSPEMLHFAHLIISDPKAKLVDPVISVTMHTLAEVDVVIERLLAQWKP